MTEPGSVNNFKPILGKSPADNKQYLLHPSYVPNTAIELSSNNTVESSFENQPKTVGFSFENFQRDKAVEYALKYCENPNPDYPNLGSNDCTNFVSQCWAYAGIPTSATWFSKGKTLKADAWVNTDEFASYMVDNGYCYISYNSNDAHVGDVIQFYNSIDGWHHSVIITKIDAAGNIYYSAHSNSRKDHPLSDVYPKGEEIRFVCVYNPG